MSICAIIPARGGSKGVPRKNLQKINGKSLVRIAIETAHSANIFDKIFVSSDDQKVLDEAIRFGAHPIKRPDKFSTDKSPVIDSIKHVLNYWLETNEETFNEFMLLQPTSPLRTSDDLVAAYDIFVNTEKKSLISVYEVSDNHPSRMYRKSSEGFLVPYDTANNFKNRQDLSRVYHRNGAIYISSVEIMRSTGMVVGGELVAYIMPKCRSLNIDDEFDLRIIKALYEL